MKEIDPTLKSFLKIKQFWMAEMEPRYKRTKAIAVTKKTLFINSKESHPIVKKKIQTNKKEIIKKINKTLNERLTDLVEGSGF